MREAVGVIVRIWNAILAHSNCRCVKFLRLWVIEMDQDSIEIDRNSPDYHVGYVINILRDFYNSVIKEGSPDFDAGVLSMFRGSGALSGAQVEEGMNDLHKNNLVALKGFGPLPPVIISCAYCCEAARALSANSRDLAWSLIANAQYWCGVSMSNKAVPLAIEKTIKESRTGTAREGGNKRAERFQPIKDEAYRLCKEKCPSKGWHSVKQAADTIAEEVDNFSRGLKIPMSSRLNITIADWLRVMPDAENIFLSMKKNK